MGTRFLVGSLLCVMAASRDGMAAEERVRASKAAIDAANMTLEQRLSKRFDPATVRALKGSDSSLAGAMTISGSEHPELFTPSELVRSFIGMTIMAQGRVREHFREKYGPAAIRLGFGGDFFDVAASQVTEYVEARKADLAEPLGKTQQSTLLRECAAATTALRNLRATFGKDFDVFLYEAIAPGMVMETRDTAEEVRAAEGGCQ